MSLTGIATKSGIGEPNIDAMLEGRFPDHAGSAWDVNAEQLRDFVDGTASHGVASLCGVSIEEAQELRDRLGREGAVGFLIGLALGKNA